MQNISSLDLRLDVAPLLAELEAHPEVWDQYRWRTNHPMSPHREASDIWVRYNAIENLGPDFNEPHESVWYPATDLIPSVRELSMQLMHAVGGSILGGVLITRIPAGKRIYPHLDRGWHAENHDKVALLLQGNREQSFCFEDGEFRCEQGECFRFENQVPHWVLNPTNEPRMTLIACPRKH